MLTSLRAVLRATARALGVERAAHTATVEEMWQEVVGPEAARHAKPVGLRGSVLLVHTETGLWAQELSAQREMFIHEINRRLGAAAVSDIRFRQGSGSFRGGAPAPAPPVENEPTLTADELTVIERVVGEIADQDLRERVRKVMTSQQRWRKRTGRKSSQQ